MTRIIKGQTLSFLESGEAQHEEKGAVAVGDDGTILWCGPQALLPQGFRHIPADDYADMLVMPGFIDAHIHFPQYRMLAAPGKDLLDWLTRFTFPEESRYADAAYARAAADMFLARLFQHELDHLDGKLMLEQLAEDERKKALREWRRLQLEGEAGPKRRRFLT